MAPIGLGKTSLTRILSTQLGTKAFYEDVSRGLVKQMLELFYSNGDESRYNLSFPLQISFLNYRFSQLRRGLRLEETQGMKNTVYDSSLASDALMAGNLHRRGEFETTQYNLYLELLANMQSEVSGHPFSGKPDLMIYLHGNFDLMLEHIQKRDRTMETNDPELLDYYKSVWDTYEAWNRSYSEAPKIVIDMNKYDFVNNLDDRRVVLEQIYDKLLEIGNIDDKEHDRLHSELNEIAF
jgi:Deoxynucleoside kinases